MRRAVPLLVLCAVAACSAASTDEARSTGGGGGGSVGPSTPEPGGPLPSAGPDQRVLEGMPVRLDGRGTRPGERGRPLRWLWTQESGPRVVLDDPTSPVTHFVAPPIRAREGTRLVFLLTVDDGERRARDRAVVELVDHPALAVPAPVVAAGPDQEVAPGAAVVLGGVRTLDVACVQEGGPAGCEAHPLPWRWVQVDGEPVDLANADGSASFSAPDREAILAFRLDAHRPIDGAPAGCGPEGPADARSFCGAPDHVRIHVRRRARLDQPPSAEVEVAVGTPGAAGMLVRFGPGLTSASYPAKETLVGLESEPDRGDRIASYGYRPILGDPRLEPLAGVRRLFLDRDASPQAKAWPRVEGFAYEVLSGRLWSAPAPIVVSWEPPEDEAPAIADAGPNPCASMTVCLPIEEGEQVALDGSGSSDPDTPDDELTYCWEQTLGPAVTFTDGAACERGMPNRTFVAPPAGDEGVQLAFRLTVDDGGLFVSRPDTTVVRVRPSGNEPPQPVLDAPDELAEGAAALLDATGSFDPEGGALAFSWRQVQAPGAPQVELRPAEGCGAEVAGACVELVAPRVVVDQPVRLELQVDDEAGLSSFLTAEVLIRNTLNEPPVAEAGPDRITASGRSVEVVGTATDPNPADRPALVYRWEVLEGGVALDAPQGPIARFAAPPVGEDLDVVLRLVATDPSGDVGTDEVRITVLAEGPYVSTAGADAGTGSRHEPFASPGRAMEIARELGLPIVKVAGGLYELGDQPLAIEHVTLRGGHDAARAWAWPSTSVTRLRTAGGIELGAAAGLSHAHVVHVGGADTLVRATGKARMRSVAVDGSTLAGARTTAVSVVGELELQDSTVTGAAATAESFGVACEPGAVLRVEGGTIVGGSGSGRHVGLSVGNGCTAAVIAARIEGGRESAGVSGSEAIALLGAGDSGLEVQFADLEGGAAATAIGARLRGGLLLDTDLRGGDGNERIGLEVAGACAAPPCVQAVGGTIRGGAGAASGTASGVRALAPVRLDAVDEIVGSEGGASAAYGLQLLAGGELVELASVRAIEAGTAGDSVGAYLQGDVAIEDAGTWLGGPAIDEAVGVEVRGAVVLQGAERIAAGATTPLAGVGIRVAAGGSFSGDALLELDGGPALGSSRGLDVAGSAHLQNALVFAGPATTAEAVNAEGPTTIHSCLLRVEPLQGLEASAIRHASGALVVRSTILDAGNAHADRAHVREAGGGLPSALDRALFVPDPGCGTDGAYVLHAGGSACSPAAIQLLGAGFSARVSAPQFVSEATGDFHLQATSPAVDWGTTVDAPAADAEGNPRGGDGDGDGLAGYDVGPLER